MYEIDQWRGGVRYFGMEQREVFSVDAASSGEVEAHS